MRSTDALDLLSQEPNILIVNDAGVAKWQTQGT